jgi:hypothetical protein
MKQVVLAAVLAVAMFGITISMGTTDGALAGVRSQTVSADLGPTEK